MAKRNRVIYQSEVLMVSPSATGNQNFSYYLTDGKNEHLLGFDSSDASSFLHPDFISDIDGRNFYVYTAPEGRDADATIAKIEAQSSDEKSVIAIGNGYVTSYSVNASVGAMATASVSVAGANIQADTNTAGANPGINPTDGTKYTNEYDIPNEYLVTGDGPTCLLPGDIEVDLDDGSLLSTVTDVNSATASHIQSVSIDIPLGRSTLNRVEYIRIRKSS